MRVDEQSLTNQTAASTTRAAESQRIQVNSASASAAGATGNDREDLSGLAGRITAGLGALANQSAGRVSQLRSQFQAGRYQPDAQQIARAMVRF